MPAIIWGIIGLGVTLSWSYDFLGYKWQGQQPTMEYYINEEGTEDVLDESQHVQKAFQVWDDVPTTAIQTRYMGMTEIKKAARDGKNVLFWGGVKEWPLGGNVVAVTMNWRNGSALQETDIIFNARNFLWSTTGEPGRMDVGHIATHEAGHALGLDHSDHPTAVMWPTSKRGEIHHRHLDSDDSLGITKLYPRNMGNNYPPEISTPPVVDAIVGLRYQYQVKADDLDGDGLKFDLVKFPLNMKIDSASGLVTWFPKFLDLGTHTVVVKVTDAMGGYTLQNFSLTVSNLVVSTPDSELPNGDTLYQEIRVTPMDEYGVYAGNIEITFPGGKLSVLEIDTTGSAVSGASFVKNITQNQVRVAFAGASPFRGGGRLFRLKMVVYPEACGERLPLNIAKALFNDGNPVAATKNGSVYMPCLGGGAYGTLAVDGKIHYFSNNEGVRQAKVKLDEAGKSAESNEEGFYAVQSVPRMLVPFRLKAVKDSGDTRNAISAYDASLILRHVVGLHNLNTYPHQKETADVNANKMVTAYDAALILRFLVNEKDLTKIGHWVLLEKERLFPSLTQNLHNINFGAYLIGDVSGNWKTSSTLMARSSRQISKDLRLTEFHAAELAQPDRPPESFSATLILENNDADIYSGEFTFSYDSEAFEFLGVSPLALLNGALVKSAGSQGQIKVVFAGTEPLMGVGELFNINLLPKKSGQPAPHSSEAEMASFRFNEESPLAVPISPRPSDIARTGVSPLKVYPNPFSNSLHIQFNLVQTAHTRISILNSQGKVLTILKEGRESQGPHAIHWNGRDQKGLSLPSGVYFLQVRTPDNILAKKIWKISE